jgi:hypothetical protein
MLRKIRNHPQWVITLVLTMLISLAAAAQEAQSTTQRTQGAPVDITYDFQLDLLLATSDQGGRAALPRPLESIGAKLKEIFPGYSYKVAGTFFGTGSDGLNIKGVSTLDLGPPTEAKAPFFYELTLGGVRPEVSDSSQHTVRISRLGYDLRVPIARVPTQRDAAGSSELLFDYQGTGLRTSMAAREGAPTVVGSLNVGRKDQMLVLVLTAKRSL